MKRLLISSRRIGVLLFLLQGVMSTAQGQHAVKIVPQPVSLLVREGSFTIDATTSITVGESTGGLMEVAAFFATYVKNISGLEIPVNIKKDKTIQLLLVQQNDLGAEGYVLQVTPSLIQIKANSKNGIFYGMQSLFQTMPAIRTNTALQIPCMEVKDYPRFKWRGMMLDVSRHFFSPDFIKEYIDLMATYKMNTFHWHLTDDQGWRIEIKKYPKLTTVGSWRVDRSDKVWGDKEAAKEGEKATYGGYYTQEQIKEIVSYAALRNITIVPEIEMPGHSSAAMAAYPHLSCTHMPQAVVAGGQYPKDIQSNFCAGNDSSFVFLQDVLTEVMQLFPSTYIHVGGDEVDKTSWKSCKLCQIRMNKEKLKDENELQSYFIRRMESFLISKQRKLIGWDEILEGGLAPEATVMSWRGESGGIAAAKMKHDVVMTPGSPCYFDHYQGDPASEPLAIGGFNTLKKVYSYEPIPAELSTEEGKYVMGAQANLWTEFIPTVQQAEYMILPRMLALAEVLWTPANQRNWSDFNKRLQPQLKTFDQKGIRYAPGNFKVDIKPVTQNGKLQVKLESERDEFPIVYTVDGTVPDAGSTRYTGPIDITKSTIVTTCLLTDSRFKIPAAQSQTFTLHKAVGQQIGYQYPAYNEYNAGNPNALADGIKGTLDHGKFWHGFKQGDVVATIQFTEEKSIHSLTIGSMQKYGAWIFLPKWVKFEVSTDGVNFTEVSMVRNTVPVDSKVNILKEFTATFSERKVKAVRVTAKRLEFCPQGHPGANQPAWIFVDELVVE